MIRRSWKQRESPAHKLAVKALYKSFLKHSERLPLPEWIRTDVKDHVKKRFRHFARRYIGYSDTRNELIKAYNLESTFRTASTPSDPSSQPAILTILSHLREIHSRRVHLLQKHILATHLSLQRPAVEVIPARPTPPRFTPHPLGPLPNVPQIVSANTIPFLRWRGHHPSEEVRSVLRDKMGWKQMHFDALDWLTEWRAEFVEEDAWEERVAAALRREGVGVDSGEEESGSGNGNRVTPGGRYIDGWNLMQKALTEMYGRFDADNVRVLRAFEKVVEEKMREREVAKVLRKEYIAEAKKKGEWPPEGWEGWKGRET